MGCLWRADPPQKHCTLFFHCHKCKKRIPLYFNWPIITMVNNTLKTPPTSLHGQQDGECCQGIYFWLMWFGCIDEKVMFCSSCVIIIHCWLLIFACFFLWEYFCTFPTCSLRIFVKIFENSFLVQWGHPEVHDYWILDPTQLQENQLHHNDQCFLTIIVVATILFICHPHLLCNYWSRTSAPIRKIVVSNIPWIS